MVRRPPGSTRIDTPFPYPPRFRCRTALPLVVAFTHMRRRGTNSAARSPRVARIANVSTQGAATSRWIDSETNLLTDWLRSVAPSGRSEEHTSELQSLMRISYAVFCLKTTTIQQHKSARHPTI